MRRAGLSAINKIQESVTENCVRAGLEVAFGHIELTATVTLNTTQHQLACSSLPPVSVLRRSSLFLSFFSPVRSDILRVQPVIVFPEVTFT